MPAQYEAIRDKFAKTMPLKAAKSHAAAIYNSLRNKKSSLPPLNPKHKRYSNSLPPLAPKGR